MPNTSAKEKSGAIRFEVDASLLFQLGERLVARRSIALGELIKNAYDADATKVTVLLDKVTRSNGTIIVEDNGIGMTFEQIQDSWMRIATNEKVVSPTSALFGRQKTGAKGVGRFAARRLADKLTLHSVAVQKSGSREKVIVEFDWTQFKPGELLTEISTPYTRSSVDDDTPTGVTLYLEKAKDAWSKEDIQELKKDILGLVNPYADPKPKSAPIRRGYKRDPGFSMELEVPEYPDLEGELAEQFLSGAWAVLTGEVSQSGTPNYYLSIRKPKEELRFEPSEYSFKELAKLRFRIHYFVYRSAYFDKASDFSVRDAQHAGRERGGVRIYLDNFRVFPYGDPGDDWLELDKAKAGRNQRIVDLAEGQTLSQIEESLSGRPWLLTPGNNQLFGAVMVSQQQHGGLEINISRDRLVENEVFENLRRFVQIGIYWMTLQYARVRTEEQRNTADKPSDKVSEVIERARLQVTNADGLAQETRREILQLLDVAGQRAQMAEEERISELSMLRVLSAAGTTVEIVNHQLRGLIDGIRAVRVDLQESVSPFVSPKAKRSLADILTRLHDWNELVVSQVSQLGFLLGPETRLRKRRPPLREAAERVKKPLSQYMKDYGIEWDNQVPSSLRTPAIFEAELHAVILHVFTNALKAVKSQRVRRISLQAHRDETNLHIRMFDTGKGISVDRREEVFKPFVTDSAPDPILGVGTGLGLKIVRDLLEVYGGTAKFVDVDDPWRTCIELVLPYEE
jgi:signal transduction histidine kinase